MSHNGLDSSQIRDVTRQAGIYVTGNYPYDQLKKLVGSGEAKLVNGKYFPAGPPSLGGYTSRREYVKSLVMSHNGLDPSQIRDITRQAGIEWSGNYPYYQLRKLVGSGDVKLVDGQYFPATASTKRKPKSAQRERASSAEKRLEPAFKSSELTGGE